MRLIYHAPEENDLLFDPTPQQMADIPTTTDHSYWLRGGNGEAAINVIREQGENVGARGSLITRDGVRVDYVAGQPSLWIKQPEPGWFFITWCHLPEGEFVPYDGSSIEPFVVEERGGDQFRVPRACLVKPSTAAEIVRDFLLSRERSPAVSWESWYELELPLPGGKSSSIRPLVASPIHLGSLRWSARADHLSRQTLCW
jgi:hypothetical protein